MKNNNEEDEIMVHIEGKWYESKYMGYILFISICLGYVQILFLGVRMNHLFQIIFWSMIINILIFGFIYLSKRDLRRSQKKEGVIYKTE